MRPKQSCFSIPKLAQKVIYSCASIEIGALLLLNMHLIHKILINLHKDRFTQK